MNAPKNPQPDVNELGNVKQRGDYTGQFTEDLDNADEIRAIENDPTLFPNSTRIYIEGEIHSDLRVPLREIRPVSYTHLTLPTICSV